MSTPNGHPTRETECPRCQRMAPELALGVLCGRERAEMLAHLQQCGRCQDRVSALAVTAERVVELVPEVEPSVGFEQRVLAAIAAVSARVSEPVAAVSAPGRSADPPGEGRECWRWPPRASWSAYPICPTWPSESRSGSARTPDRRRRLVAAATLTGVCAMLITGGDLASTSLVAAPPPSIGPAMQTTADVISAPLISDTESHADQAADPGTIPLAGRPRREIGKAWIHPQSPSWVYISITDTPGAPEPPAPNVGHDLQGTADIDETVTCVLIPPTGGTINLGTFTLRNGHADWATSITIDARTLAQAQLTIEHGHTVARATFHATASPTSMQSGRAPDRESGGNKDGDHPDVGTEKSKKGDTRDSASQGGTAAKGQSRDKVSASGDQNGGIHTAGGGSLNPKHRHNTDQSNGKDRHGGPGDIRDVISSAVGDHSQPGDHRSHSQHDGNQQLDTSAGGGHQAGGHGVEHHQSDSGKGGAGKVSTLH